MFEPETHIATNFFVLSPHFLPFLALPGLFLALRSGLLATLRCPNNWRENSMAAVTAYSGVLYMALKHPKLIGSPECSVFLNTLSLSLFIRHPCLNIKAITIVHLLQHRSFSKPKGVQLCFTSSQQWPLRSSHCTAER